MNILTVDIGNTNTVFGLYCEDSLAGVLRIKTELNLSVADYSAKISAFIRSTDIGGSHVSGAVLMSVVPDLNVPVGRALQSIIEVEPFVVSHEIDTGIKICYEDPVQVGLDRVVNAVGAFVKYRQSVIVVDMGTATTFDYVSDSGEFMGGAISPGLRISAEALFEKTSLLPRVALKAPDRTVCRDTVSNIQSGIIFGYAGLVDTMVNRMIKETGRHPRVIATGGLSSLVYPYCEALQVMDEYLTHFGLKTIFERQVQAT